MGNKLNRVVFIGDVHGLTTWEPVVKRALSEHSNIVFLGDYVDSFFLTPEQIMVNLLKIIEYKKKYPHIITLLLGNHDWAYYRGKFGISGFQSAAYENYRDIFAKNIDLFDIAWGYTSDFKVKYHANCDPTPIYTLATHGGLSKGFYDHLVKSINDPKSNAYLMLDGIKWKDAPLHALLNKFKDSDLLWKVGTSRGGWGCGSVLWEDKYDVLGDHYPNIDQVAGHTPGYAIEAHNLDGDMLYFVDNYGNEQLFWLHLEL